MTSEMIVEAVSKVAAQEAVRDPAAIAGVSGVEAANPASVARFQAAMAVSQPQAIDPVPFATEIAGAWRAARENNQTLVHRIKALTQMSGSSGPASGEMLELQYNVMNLSFQQEVVTKVADKTSSAIQTLIKNQ